MIGFRILMETGKKKTFANALDWPGWCRGGRDVDAALQALVASAPRYAQALVTKGVAFPLLSGYEDFMIVEQKPGDVTTDFGAPSIIAEADREPVNQEDFTRFRVILEGCWQTFDRSVQLASGKTLRVGPRGGGRNLERIIEHVIEAEKAYLGRVAWKGKIAAGSQAKALILTRQAILDSLEVAEKEGLPERGPRGGVIWPVRFFVRRVAWHVLDHAWEIEDRGEEKVDSRK